MAQAAQQNLQQFDYFTGVIFGQLYDALPNPIVIDCYEIAKEEKFNASDWSEGSEHAELAKNRASQDPLVKTCLNTGRWLRQEGFISYSVPLMPMTFELSLQQATLGHKGLIAMRRLPGELDENIRNIRIDENFGQVLSRMAKFPRDEAYKTAIAEVTNQLLGLSF